MEKSKKYDKFKERNFDYNADDSAQIIYNNISPALQQKFEYEDILTILDLRKDFLILENGIDLSIEGKDDEDINLKLPPLPHLPKNYKNEEMRDYIIETASEHEIFLTADELQKIFEAESIYLNKIYDVEV